MTAATIPCKTCDRGELVRRKRYRMSGIVVFLGYVLLIPSMLGVFVGLVTLTATGKTTTTTMTDTRESVRTDLQGAAVPEAVITEVTAGRTPAASTVAVLPQRQRDAVSMAQARMTGATAGAGIGFALAGGVALAIIVTSLLAGLLGWLLTMKKQILQCTNCQAVVAAS